MMYLTVRILNLFRQFVFHTIADSKMSKENWSTEETERLISLVKTRPCLFDKTTVVYRCKLTNDQAWREISEEMKQDGEKLFWLWFDLIMINLCLVSICKKKWSALRTYKRLELRTKKSGSGFEHTPKWLFSKQMSLFEKHFVDRV